MLFCLVKEGSLLSVLLKLLT